MTVGFQPRVLIEKVQPRRRNLYEGTTKSILEGVDPGTFILYFKDDHPMNEAANPLPLLNGKGVINNRLSELLFERLTQINIDHHFVKRLNMREQVVRMAENLPFYVDVHNAAADDFVTRFNYPRHGQLPEMIAELRFKNKKAHDPVVAPQHLIALGLTDDEELDQLFQNIQRINDFLIGQFSAHDLLLVRYKLEFGRVYMSENPMDTRLILIDELSLDTCRVMDAKTNKRLDALQSAVSKEELEAEKAAEEQEFVEQQSATILPFNGENLPIETAKSVEEPAASLDPLEGYYEIVRRFKIFPNHTDDLSNLT